MTVARIAPRKKTDVHKVPSPRPTGSAGLVATFGDASQSPMFAPSGRVRMYASQNDSTGLAPNFHSRATDAIRASGRNTDCAGGQLVSSSVQSPVAVPR